MVFCVFVLTFSIAATAFAAGDDPLTVVNNLSDFVFGLIRAIGIILLGFGVLQLGLSLKSHDPSQRGKRYADDCRRHRHNFYQRDPYAHYRLNLYGNGETKPFPF